MRLRILACESLGVRSMACVVETRNMKLLIDPGVALGLRRFRLSPHTLEKDEALKVQRLLQNELATCTHVVITHFHGDHHPMVEAETSQLGAYDVLTDLKRVKIFAKGYNGMSRNQQHRRRLLEKLLGKSLIDADEKCCGEIEFSEPVPHGECGNRAGTLIMVKVKADNTTFAHGSDIQLLDEEACGIICQWKPDVVFVGGPPVYMVGNQRDLMSRAHRFVEHLAASCGTLVLDHHTMRSRSGEEWLDRVSERIGKTCRMCCGADFLDVPRRLLEADRKLLHRSGNDSQER